MSKLEFIDSLIEARMFQSPSDVKGKSAENVADIVYLMIMMLEVIRHTNTSWAADYASQTMTYNTYEAMHYSGTDLGNMLAVLNNQDTFKGFVKVNGNISIPLFQLNRYLGAVRSRSNSHNEDATFFWRLEEYLKIYSKSTFRQLRREIGDWERLTRADKIKTIQILRREFDSRMSSVDMYLWFKTSFKLKESKGYTVNEGMEQCYVDELFGRLVKSGDCTKEQLNNMKEGLFESSELNTVRKFFELHKKDSLTPTVGQFYVPVSIMFISPMKLIVIESLSSPAELLLVAPREDYKFRVNGRIQRFPNNVNQNTSLADTMFYESSEEAQQLITMALMQLQWPDWKIKHQIKESVEEAIDTKLAYHKELNPAIWNQDAELHDDVKDALAKIANKFSDFVDIKQLKIVDYIITGSNCAFNYTDDSDIDLHVLVDASQLGNNPLTEPFLMAKKSLWNSGHDITVKGFTVELYAEDINRDDNKLVATGIYSLLHDKWIKKPEYKKVQVDDYAVQVKAQDVIEQIEFLISSQSTDTNEIQALWDHIRKMRRTGLEKEGEFSVENLAFKAIRNNGVFDRLREYERTLEDQDLTLEAITGPVNDNDISFKSAYFPYKTPVVDKIHGLILKKALHGDDLYYGLFDPSAPIRNTLVGLLQLEKYNESLWQVRLVQIDEQFKSQGFGTYLYDYAVMNDGLSILSDTNLTEGDLGGSKGLWEKLYRHGRYTVCGYNLDSDEILPNLTPTDVFNQHEDLVCLATPKVIKESIHEMLTRINSKNTHRIVEWYGPSVKASGEF